MLAISLLNRNINRYFWICLVILCFLAHRRILKMHIVLFVTTHLCTRMHVCTYYVHVHSTHVCIFWTLTEPVSYIVSSTGGHLTSSCTTPVPEVICRKIIIFIWTLENIYCCNMQHACNIAQPLKINKLEAVKEPRMLLHRNELVYTKVA